MKNSQWTLVWHDEFNSPEIDPARWLLDVGYTGESNGELEIYTNRPENAKIVNGCLVITARQENYQGFSYTSARLTTRGIQSWKFGRLEARIKLPSGQGIWPAFWMLGDDISSQGWPACGEIDIMENLGHKPDTVRGTIHGPGYYCENSVGADFTLPGKKFPDDFHIFAVEWEPDEIRWYVDESHTNTLGTSDVPGKWVFDHPFFILLNLAVGGYWPGYPDETTVFPQCMLVDYVRVYQKGKTTTMGL